MVRSTQDPSGKYLFIAVNIQVTFKGHMRERQIQTECNLPGPPTSTANHAGADPVGEDPRIQNWQRATGQG